MPGTLKVLWDGESWGNKGEEPQWGSGIPGWSLQFSTIKVFSKLYLKSQRENDLWTKNPQIVHECVYANSCHDQRIFCSRSTDNMCAIFRDGVLLEVCIS